MSNALERHDDAEKTVKLEADYINQILRQDALIGRFENLTEALARNGENICSFGQNEEWQALHDELEKIGCEGAISRIVVDNIVKSVKNKANEQHA